MSYHESSKQAARASETDESATKSMAARVEPATGCDLVFVRDFSRFYRVALRAAIGAYQTP
jgi:hypothetical protein